MERLMQYRVPVITAFGAVLLVVIVYMAWIAPEGSKLSSLRSKETQLQSQQTELEGQITTLKREKEHLSSTCATLTQEVTAVPSAPDVDSFFRQVTALAVTSGDPNTPSISVTQATATAKGTGGATPVAVSFALAGTYGQMSAFLNGLYTFPRFFTITTIQLGGGAVSNGGIAPAGGTPNYTLTLTGNIYYSASQQNVCLTLPTS